MQISAQAVEDAVMVEEIMHAACLPCQSIPLVLASHAVVAPPAFAHPFCAILRPHRRARVKARHSPRKIDRPRPPNSSWHVHVRQPLSQLPEPAV